MEPHSNPRLATFVALGLVAVMVIGSVIFVKYFQAPAKNPAPLATALPSATPTASATPVAAHESVFFYATETKETTDSTRSWPTENIYMKIGNADAQLLATLGKVGEYPEVFTLSKDHKTLYVNLESRIAAITIATKAVTTVFTPQHKVFSYTLSPDGNEMLIWDEDFYATEGDTEYIIHRYNLTTQTDTQVAKGSPTDKHSLFLGTWRSDNKVLGNIGLGEGVQPAYLDVATGAITALQDLGSLSLSSSADGTLLTANLNTVENICDKFGGASPSTGQVVNPLTGKLVMTFGKKDRIVSPRGFSPDNALLLYSEATPWTKDADCDKTPTPSYFTVDTATGKMVTAVSDVEALLPTWGIASFKERDALSALDKTTVVASYVE